MNTPRRLPTFEHAGKVWTVDQRLGEFRHLVFGEMPEYVPFSSERGAALLLSMEVFFGSDALGPQET